MSRTFVVPHWLADELPRVSRVLHNGTFDPDDWPRDPAAYRPTDHFRNRFRDPDRHLTGDRINAAISTGECLPAVGSKAMFCHDEDGVRFHFVVGDDPHRAVVTGYPLLTDKGRACESDAFERADVDAIEAFSARHLAKRDVRETINGILDLPVTIPSDANKINFQ